MAEWFYHLEGTNQGPVSEGDLRHIFDSGALPLSTPVWCEGMEDWVEAKTIPEVTGSPINVPSDKQQVQIRPDLLPKTKSKAKWVFYGLAGCLLICLIVFGSWAIHSQLSKRERGSAAKEKKTQNAETTSLSESGLNNYSRDREIAVTDKDKGADTLSEEVDQGNAEARACRSIAEAGEPYAQYNLGAFYDSGLNVKKNKTEAAKWFLKAAKQGIVDAQYNLGLYYFYEEGAAQDKAEAIKWWRKAAEQGDAPAQFNLAVCYYKGDGVSKDQVEAVKWFRKAADQGNVDAAQILKETGN